MKRIVIAGLIIIVVGGVLLSVIALLLETDPPVVQEPNWDSPQTRALAVRACFDCHSNQTNWTWWTRLPVGSWIAVFDTVRGRRELNFSNWGQGGEQSRRARQVQRVIENGSMPPRNYLLLHPEAALTDDEKQQLITGLQNSLK